MTPPHHGLPGQYSQRGLESWRKLPTGPRPHLQPIKPGVPPPTPVLGFRPACLCLLSPLQGAPQHQPLLKQHCWQLSKQADHSIPFFLPFLLVLLILNTARRLLGLLPWNEHSPKRPYWINWFVYVCFNFFPFLFFFFFFLRKNLWSDGEHMALGGRTLSASPTLKVPSWVLQKLGGKPQRFWEMKEFWTNGAPSYFMLVFFKASFLLFYSLKLVFIDHIRPYPIALFINGSGMPYTY